jgi:hypothetical protein
MTTTKRSDWRTCESLCCTSRHSSQQTFPETETLNRFCTILVGSKSGLMVKNSMKADDHSRWGHLKFGGRGESSKVYTTYGLKPRVNAQRPPCLGRDIIDEFHSVGTRFLVSSIALVDPADDSLVISYSTIAWTRWRDLSHGLKI